jgi:hypothetical protein
MATVKIRDLPYITSLQPNTANTVLVGVDVPGNYTGQMTLTTLARGLYSHNYLVVGDYSTVYPNAVATFAGGANTYVQSIIENTQDPGTADIVAQANVSTDTAYFIDVGFTGNTYNNTSPYNSLGTSVSQLDGYIYVQGLEGSKGGNLTIGTVSSNTRINYIVGGVNSQNIVAYMTTAGIFSPSINSLVAANVSTLRGEVTSNVSTINSSITANATSANSVINTNISANVATLRGEITANATSANSVINTNISANIATANLFTQAAFDKANNALANTTGILNGSLTVTGTLNTGNVTINNGVSLNDAGVFQYTTANNTTVTQLTNKSTAVYSNGRTGQITTNNASLAKGSAVSFTVYNTQVVSAKDVIVTNIASGGTLSSYQVCTDAVAPGSFSICLTNNGTGALAEALVINYAIIRVN